ncbi:MAG: leucyl aminopeptidase family protein [Thermoplasmatota archaeon]
MDCLPATASELKAEAYIVGVDDRRRAPGLKLIALERDAAVTTLLANDKAALPPKSVRTLPTAKGWLILVGMGPAAKRTPEFMGTLANVGSRAAAAIGCRTAATTLPSDLASQGALRAVVQGALIGALDFDQWKRKKEPPAPPENRLERLLVLAPAAAARRVVAREGVVARAVNDARILCNTPANVATPAWLAAEAQARGRKGGFRVQVMGRDELRKGGYGALCGVGQGSAQEEKLIVLDYHPKGAKKTLAVVGKGVCFDSGGISLKPGDKMWEMKYDKAGACNTIALMACLKALGIRQRVVGIVAAVENMPSATAQRPGDIVTAKDGTTIEVLNTDAEGRLILADAVTHARTFGPRWIIDMATLTGACDVAVGPTYVAVMSNQEAFAKALVDDAAAAGDKAWHLPQGPEYSEANKGTYADLQNISLTNRAGASVGGAFIGHFAKDTKWAHLDIASKAWTGGVDYFTKGPTGAGLRIVLERIVHE